MVYNIQGQNIKITPEMIDYGYWRNRFLVTAEQFQERFSEEYDENCHDIEDVVEYVKKRGGQWFAHIAKGCISELEKEKVYLLDLNSYTKKYLQGDYFEEFFGICNAINEQYLQIVDAEKAAAEYRRMRKASRGKFSGGGFGISGALKGAAKASLMNMATGAAHSMVNAFGDLGTAGSVARQKKKLFEECGIKEAILEAFYNAIFNMRWTLIHAMECEVGKKYMYPDDEDIKISEILYQKLVSGKVPDDDIPMIIGQLVRANPYHMPFYKFYIRKYGDKDHTIDKLGEDLDLNIYGVKYSILGDFLHERFPEDEVDIDEVRNVAKSVANFYGIEQVWKDMVEDMYIEEDEEDEEID